MMRAHKPPLLGHLDPASARQVEELLRNAAPRVRTRLVGRVGADLPVGAVTVEWAPLGQVLDRLAGSATARFLIEPAGLSGLVAVEPDLLTLLVGQILGQPSERAWTGPSGRAPSRFDLVIARRLAEDVMGGIMELIPKELGQSVSVDSGPAQRELGVPRTALVGLAHYEIPIAGAEGSRRIVVVLPSEVTRLVLPRKTQRPEARMGMERVMPLPVVAVAELRRITVSLAELKEIRPGHTLDLGAAKDVVIRVGDRSVLLGEAGVQNQMRSVRVRSRADGLAPSLR